jgi:hypothetical protein
MMPSRIGQPTATIRPSGRIAKLRRKGGCRQIQPPPSYSASPAEGALEPINQGVEPQGSALVGEYHARRSRILPSTALSDFLVQRS